MVFEGFCGVYMENKVETEKGAERIMLQDTKVGSLVGVESHMYDGCTALFTCKTNEKTKLLFIDKKGFDLYIKEYMLTKH